jgi:hypothetical protein
MQGSRVRSRRMSFERLEDRSLLAALAVPQLSSRPGAAAAIYLDFDGNIEPQWGSHANVVTPPYDTDGNKSSYSAVELAAIREIWTRVSEDYAPFNINVTTVAAPSFADRRAVHIAIGGSYSDWYGSTAGGVSYVGGFSSGASNVGFVFADTLGGGNPRYVAEAASHEAGHLFGLEHQAAWSGGQLASEYNTGTAAWAPIMGASYYAARTTWANGPTTAGPTADQDDLSIIASPTNGFGYVPDDYGNTIATAAALPVSASSINLAGLIGRNDDRDVFKFTTGGGAASFTLGVAQYGADLDGVIELQNSAGKTLAVANPATTLGASLSTTLATGTYYLVVHSSGGYGNLGRYTLHGSASGATATPITQPPPTTTPIPSPPQDKPEGESSTTPPAPPPPSTTATIRVADDGDSGFASTGVWQKLTGVGYASDTHWAAAGNSAASTWNFTGLAPGQYRLAATWSGSRLNALDAPFSISSGSRSLGTVKVNQQRSASTFTSGGAAWQSLGTFTITGSTITVRLNSAASGRVVADAIRLERVYSTSGGSALKQAGVVDANGAAVFAAPLAPAASQPLQQSPAAILAAAADGYFQAAATATAQPAGIFSHATNPLASENQPDELPVLAIDAALTDGTLLGGVG